MVYGPGICYMEWECSVIDTALNGKWSDIPAYNLITECSLELNVTVLVLGILGQYNIAAKSKKRKSVQLKGAYLIRYRVWSRCHGENHGKTWIQIYQIFATSNTNSWFSHVESTSVSKSTPMYWNWNYCSITSFFRLVLERNWGPKFPTLAPLRLTSVFQGFDPDIYRGGKNISEINFWVLSLREGFQIYQFYTKFPAGKSRKINGFIKEIWITFLVH